MERRHKKPLVLFYDTTPLKRDPPLARSALDWDRIRKIRETLNAPFWSYCGLGSGGVNVTRFFHFVGENKNALFNKVDEIVGSRYIERMRFADCV